VFAPRYGLVADWIRKSSSVPQEIMEDVLGAVLRSPGLKVPISKIEKNVTSRNMKIRRAITMLARQDLLSIEGNHVLLTDDGRIEANRLVRAHRLWETYLEQTGVPSVEIHKKAHQLEHISDQATADQKVAEVLCSVLRDGDQATVVKVKPMAASLELTVGDEITMGPRSADGKIWQLQLSDGTACQLNHAQADAVVVKVIQSHKAL